MLPSDTLWIGRGIGTRRDGLLSHPDSRPPMGSTSPAAHGVRVCRRYQGASAIPYRMARLLRLLRDPAGTDEPGSVDPPKITFISLAAVGNGQNRFKDLRRRGVSVFRAAVAAGSPTGFSRMSRTSGGPCGPAQRSLRIPLGLPDSTFGIRLNPIEPPWYAARMPGGEGGAAHGAAPPSPPGIRAMYHGGSIGLSRIRNVSWARTQRIRSDGCAGPHGPPDVLQHAPEPRRRTGGNRCLNTDTPRRRSSLKRLCPFPHCRQRYERNLRRIHASRFVNTRGVWQKPK